jgi:hypothetical protein
MSAALRQIATARHALDAFRLNTANARRTKRGRIADPRVASAGRLIFRDVTKRDGAFVTAVNDMNARGTKRARIGDPRVASGRT